MIFPLNFSILASLSWGIMSWFWHNILKKNVNYLKKVQKNVTWEFSVSTDKFTSWEMLEQVALSWCWKFVRTH